MSVKHMTFGGKDLLLGDAVAVLVVEYTALLASKGSADSVTVHAYGYDGADVAATLVLDQGAVVVVESSDTSLPAPDNTQIEAYIRSRLDAATAVAQPVGRIDIDEAVEELEKGYAPGGEA